jgi:signal transduction histidine kinase
MRGRKSILLGGAFAALMVVIGVSAFAIWRNATTAQDRVAALHDTHLEAGIALASIRANVYLIGILTRDYLLDSDPARALQYDRQFQSVRRSIAANFHLLDGAVQDDQQRSALDRLRRGVDAYWDPTALVLDWTAEQKIVRRTEFLSERVRRREEIAELAGQVERLMTENFSREKERTTKADGEFRSSLAWTVGVSLLLSLGIAGVTMARMIVLERRSAVSESELRRLSGQVRTAQEQERKYLSRELHDQVGQMLTGLRMELSSLAGLHGDSESERFSRIAHAKGIVEQTLRIVRNIATLLRPSVLDDLGLEPALAWLVKDISRTSGIEIEAHIDSALDSLPDAHRTCLYRVVQEALTNVSRHSRALKAEVSLRKGHGWVTGNISDDGRGFDTNANRRDGLGLVGMQERVRELGGQIQVVSVPGRGTRIELRLPIPQEPEAADDSHPDRGRSRDRSNRVETSA